MSNVQTMDLEELSLNNDIANLRLKLARLKDAKFKIKQEIKKTGIQRDSARRKYELERETEVIQQELAAKRAEAFTRLSEGPWFDPTYTKEGYAFKWQVDGALMLPERALLGDKRGLGKTL